MKYKFIGKPDYVFPDLVTGKVYDLTIETYHTGVIAPVWLSIFFPYKEKLIITSPIRCPYSSWEAFNKNWEEVK